MIIQTKNLSKKYNHHSLLERIKSKLSTSSEDFDLRSGSLTALNRLNISVPSGSAYGLIGANGAGKSTLIKILLNILQPSNGTANLLSIDSRKITPVELAKVGYVSESQQLPKRLTVEEYFDYLRPFYDSWDRELEVSIRRKFELPANRKIGHLSHGMRLKMALCCALPYRPKLMILDEPFSGLDSLARDEFMAGLIERAWDMTILISSHEHVEFEMMLSHIGYLQKGKLLFEEPMDQVTSRFKNVSVVLKPMSLASISLPTHWINARKIGNSLTFVETEYSREKLDASIKSLIDEVIRFDVQPMSLRSIFTALELAAREHNIP